MSWTYRPRSLPLAVLSAVLVATAGLGACSQANGSNSASAPLPETLVPESGNTAEAGVERGVTPALTSSSASPPATGSPTARHVSSTSYSLDLDLDYTGHSAEVIEVVLVRNNSGEPWDRLVFQAAASRVPGAFRLHEARWAASEEGQLAWIYDPQTLTYVFPRESAILPGESVGIILEFGLRAPPTSYSQWPPSGDLGYSDRLMQFGNWYPILVPYEEGQGWRTWPFAEVGDPYVSETASYDLQVHHAGSLVVASGGTATPLIDGWRFQFEQARSVGFSVSPSYQVRCNNGAGIQVCSYFLPEHIAAGEDVLDAAVASVRLLSEFFGPYPYESLTIAEDAFFGSMEYTGFILHSGAGYAQYDGSPKAMIIALTPHEVAHQWWYSLVGTDQAIEPWLDEALATYAELSFYRAFYPSLEDWYWAERVDVYNPAGPLDRTIYDFPDTPTYNHQLYRRGVQFLSELETAMGSDRFRSFLKELREEGEGSFLGTGDFFRVLGRYGEEYMRVTDGYFSE